MSSFVAGNCKPSNRFAILDDVFLPVNSHYQINRLLRSHKKLFDFELKTFVKIILIDYIL